MQVLAVGVIVMVALIVVVPVFVAAKAGILPVPLAERPITGLLLVHEKVVPAPTGLETVVAEAPMPLQKVWLGIGSMVGVGLTVIE